MKIKDKRKKLALLGVALIATAMVSFPVSASSKGTSGKPVASPVPEYPAWHLPTQEHGRLVPWNATDSDGHYHWAPARTPVSCSWVCQAGLKLGLGGN